MGRVISRGPQNYFSRSIEFENTLYWQTIRATVTDGSIAGPRGLIDGTRLQEDGSNNTHYTRQTKPYSYGITYCHSIVAQADERSFIYLAPVGVAMPANSWSWFNLTTGAVGAVGAGVVNAGVDPAGGNWFRCWSSVMAIANANEYFIFYLATAGGVVNYPGDNASGLYIYNAQRNIGSTPDPLLITREVARTSI